MLSPVLILSWFFFPRRWLLVWPYWVLFLFWISTDGDVKVIDLPQAMRVVMVNTTNEGMLEGPIGVIETVKRLGIDRDEIRCQDGDGPIEPLSAIYSRQQSHWPPWICGILAVAPFAIYLKKRLMAARVVSISSSV